MSIVNLPQIEHKIVGRMLRTVRILEKMISEEVSQYKLTKPQMDVLVILKYSDQESVTTTELAEELFVSKANITGIVTRLENANLIQKVTDPNDTRSKKITVTEEGEALIEKVIPRYFSMGVEAFSNLSQEEKEKLLAQLLYIEEFYSARR